MSARENQTDKPNNQQMSDYKLGLLLVLGCQFFWGFMPIYWHALEDVPSWKIIIYRIFTMFVYCYIAAVIVYGKEAVWKPIRTDRAVVRKHFAAGLILTLNWSIYVWAMTSGRVIQAAIGYYIEPIVICAFGIFIFKEQVTKYNLTAILFALVAIALILAHYRQLPGVALGLALTWATYSAIKKAADLPALIALVYETMPYAIVAFFAIIYIEAKGIGVISMHMPVKYMMVLGSGLMTMIPVSLFGYAAKKTTLLIIGLTQYISPTITLILGIFAFHEPIDKTQILAFIIIWTGLAVFTYGEFKHIKETGGVPDNLEEESILNP